jgi:hypothetical protein
MKKIILFTFLAIFSLGTFAITPDLKSQSENPAIPDKKENKMSEEEINKLSGRVEEARDMDKSKQVIIVKEGHRKRGNHEGMNRNNRRNGGAVFIGGGGVILLVILLIILI